MEDVSNKDQPLSDRLEGLPEMAELLGVSIPTMRRLAHTRAESGAPVEWNGGRWWANRAAFSEWCRGFVGGGRARRVVGVPAIAVCIGVSRPTAQRLLRDRATTRIPAHRVGGRWFADRERLKAWAKMDGARAADPGQELVPVLWRLVEEHGAELARGLVEVASQLVIGGFEEMERERARHAAARSS